MSVSKKSRLFPLTMLISAMIYGCGGSSDNTNPPTNPEPPQPPSNSSPVVSVDNDTAAEGTLVTIAAIATDSDGSIASYQWRQVSGPTVVLNNVDAANVSFTAPNVDQDTNLVFEVTVTDDDGASSSDTGTILVTDVPQTQPQQITVRGKIAGTDLPNANVQLTIGDDNPIETTADENGNFAYTLQYDATKADKLMKFEATATDDSQVRLVSNVGSYQRVFDAANSSNVVTKDELQNLVVSNITTAVNGLMKEANNGEEITSVEQMETTAIEYEANMVIPFSATLKQIIESDNSNEPVPQLVEGLPEGVNDTAELMADLPRAQAALLSILKDDPEAFKSLVEELLSDGDLFSNNLDANSTVSDTSYLKPADRDFSGDRLEVIDENTLRLYNRNLDISPITVTRQDTEEGMLLTYPDNGALSHDESVDFPETSDEPLELIRLSTLIKSIAENENSLQITVQHNHVMRPVNGDNGTGDQAIDTPSYQALLVKEENLKNASEFLDLTDNCFTIPTPSGLHFDDLENRGTPEYVDEKYKGLTRSLMKLCTDETGNATLTRYDVNDANELISQELPVTLELVDGHLVLTVALGEANATFDLAFYSDTSPYFINGMLTDPDGKSTPISSYVLQKETDANWSDSNVQGIYALDWNMDAPDEYFWIELKENNLAVTVKTFDDNQDGTLSADEFSIEAGLWQIQENGELFIRRYSEATIPEEPNKPQSCQPSSFTPNEADTCKIWHQSQWDLQSIKGKQYYVINTHIYYRLSDTLPATGTTTGEVIYSSIDNRSWIKLGTEDSDRPIAIPAELIPPQEN